MSTLSITEFNCRCALSDAARTLSQTSDVQKAQEILDKTFCPLIEKRQVSEKIWTLVKQIMAENDVDNLPTSRNVNGEKLTLKDAKVMALLNFGNQFSSLEKTDKVSSLNWLDSLCTPSSIQMHREIETKILKSVEDQQYSMLSKYFQEILEKAVSLGVPLDLVSRFEAQIIGGIPYIIVPVSHNSIQCNLLIIWIMQQAAYKRWSHHVENMYKGLEVQILKCFGKYAQELANIPYDGYVYGMEAPFFSAFIGFGEWYIEIKSQDTLDKSLKKVQEIFKKLCRNFEGDKYTVICWEALEKEISSNPILSKAVDGCNYKVEHSLIKRVNVLERHLLSLSKQNKEITVFCELFKSLTFIALDRLDVPQSEKDQLKQDFQNSDITFVWTKYIEFHSPRRELIAIQNILKDPNLPSTVRVITMGFAHKNNMFNHLLKEAGWDFRKVPRRLLPSLAPA